MATLTVRGLRKTYGATTALHGLDFEVASGEFFVILGPSGAGKTTTLKSVAGLVDIDGGAVSIGGRDMTGVEPYHRNVGMAFESYALYPQKTVAENLASPLNSGRLGTFSPTDQSTRIDAVTTTLGINHLLGRFPRELSNGQRQRTALGRVLVRPADIYLLDEPLSHLDAKLRAAMRAELKTLALTSDTTTLYVTHDYQEALALGDRIAVLREGRLVQVGPPEQVWKRPVDTFVARALGQPELNLIDAVVQDGQIHLVSGAARFAAPPGLALTRGQRVRLGIRPRELLLGGAHSEGSWLTIPGTTLLSERLGRHVELDVEAGADQLIAVCGSDQVPAEGQSVTLRVALESVHVFEAGDPGTDTARIGSAAGAPQPASDREDR
jgi:multiple sugar transport system ATP-binding protein